MKETTEPRSPRSPVHSVLLNKALARYRAELEDKDACVLDVDTVDELLKQAKDLQPPGAHSSKASTFLHRLEPILSHINDFAAAFALCKGTDAKATAIIWGSLRVILTLASPAGDAMEDLLSMLDELSLSLPRFRAYEDTLPMTPGLESALIDVYTEMTCFCARIINFFQGNPHRPLLRRGWPKLDDDFKHTIKRLRTLSRQVDQEADTIRLKADRDRNTELIAAMEHLKVDRSKADNLPCQYIPFGVHEHFYGREDILNQMCRALDPPDTGRSVVKCCVLHGLGGVGKTKLALKYANESRRKFDAIFWISADNSIKMVQDFLEVSKRLGLSPETDDAQDAVAALSRVKLWLADTDCKWLIIFDNADDPNVLVDAWPGSAPGSILVTSRDPAVGFGASTERIQVKPFDLESGVAAFLRLTDRDPNSTADRKNAEKIVKTLGGLPLAINQISGYIVQRKLKLDAFLPLYERYASRIDAQKLSRGGSEHTLSTVWHISLSQLSGPSSTLQKMLAFFDPDRVHESVLVRGGELVSSVPEFEFLTDEMDFLDAKAELMRVALLEWSEDDETLSMHRLVQSAIMKLLSPEEMVKYLDAAVTILSNGFPNTWNVVTAHQFTAWAQCERCLPHVSYLIHHAKKYNIISSDPKAFAELIFRCSWYLYEREQYEQARTLMNTAFLIFESKDKDKLFYASALMLHGLIELDTCNFKKALECFEHTLVIREPLLDKDDALIASSLNAISIATTELGDLDRAVETQTRAINIRLHTNSDRIGNSYSNMASTLLKMGKHDEAEEMLARCPSLKDFTDDTFINSGNPRFSGDMVLLARIRQRQGRIDDALRLASKALDFRQKMLGNRLKTIDSLYQVAVLLQEREDFSSAINLLEESIAIAENLPFSESGRYQARASYRLWSLYRRIGSQTKAQEYLKSAKTMYAKITGDQTKGEAIENFDNLVAWMLW